MPNVSVFINIELEYPGIHRPNPTITRVKRAIKVGSCSSRRLYTLQTMDNKTQKVLLDYLDQIFPSFIKSNTVYKGVGLVYSICT
jgi:hypothetical protein